MSIFQALIQGIVQGLTEFLPVSSSGHLTITQHVFGVSESNLFFDVMLHIGTLVAVCVFYRKLLWRLIKEFFITIAAIFRSIFRMNGERFSWKEMSHDRRLIFMLIIGLLPLFLLFVPIPGTDMKIKDLADLFTQPSYFIIVGISLLITSVLLIIGNECSRKNLRPKTNFTVGDSIIVGLTQMCTAVFPGLSRSGSTLSVAQMRGVNKSEAFDYVFVISIPSIVAAALLETKEFFELDSHTIDIMPVVVGVLAAAIVGYLALVLFRWLLKTNKMFIFIIYTAIVGILVIIVSVIEMNTGVNLFNGTII